MLLQQLSGPVIGAIIGYCTNYIAVKMLFYPRKEIYVCGHKLPLHRERFQKEKTVWQKPSVVLFPELF